MSTTINGSSPSITFTDGTTQSTAANITAPYTSNGVVYASSTTALATGSALTFDGSNFKFTGSDNNNLVYSANSNGTSSIRMQSNAAGNYLVSAGPSAWYLQNGSSSGFISFAPASGTERMRLDSSGNLLLGTTSAVTGYKMHMAGAIYQDQSANGSGAGFAIGGGYVCGPNSTTIYAGMQILNQYLSNNLSEIAFYTTSSAGSAAEAMRIDGTGRLLIGATASFGSGVLEVKGSSLCMTINSGSYNYSFGTDSNNFNVYDGAGTLRGYLTSAGTWTNTSDIAFKKDIVDIKYSLSDLLKLRPVSYVTKDYDIPQIGFIAQEMEQIIPEVVSGKEGLKGISYGNITALLVKAIQEQQALITQLTTRLTALENKA